MATVKAKVKLSPKSRTYQFGDGWNFEINGFTFHTVEAVSLYVSYEFEYEIERDDPDFGKVLSGPHESDNELLEKEYELETLLDVIALEAGVGLRIETDTYSFIWGNSSESMTTNGPISFDANLGSIAERFTNLLNAEESLQDALRFYRLNTLEDDLGERAMQLWTVIERLYGKQPNEKYLSRDEVNTIMSCIEGSSIADEKHKKIRDALNYINPINTLDLLADRIKLKTQDGPMSASELKELLRYWKELRGSQGHGRYLLRSEDLEFNIWDIEDTVELFLESKVSPKLYHVYIFRDSSLGDDWKKHPSLLKIGEWNIVPSRGAGLMGLANVMRHSLRDDKAVYIFDYARIIRVNREGFMDKALEELDPSVRAIVNDEQLKMREDNQAE